MCVHNDRAVRVMQIHRHVDEEGARGYARAAVVIGLGPMDPNKQQR
jgi:enterochelin esterase-like enzyme